MCGTSHENLKSYFQRRVKGIQEIAGLFQTKLSLVNEFRRTKIELKRRKVDLLSFL